MSTVLSPEQLARDLAVRDLTDPTSGPHGIQQLIDIATRALTRAWGCPARVLRGPRVVPLADNYDRLRYPPDAVTRDARYSRYVDRDHMLRSHASAMIPPALEQLAADPVPDVLLACPGITYRRDAIDRLHTGAPHQLDLWRITSRTRLGVRDLDEMITLLAQALFPGRDWRWEPRDHPYTVHGRQIDVRVGDEWIEVWECGLAHPDVLADAGLTGSSGLALGMGLDRLFMLVKGIADIRLLRSADPRIADQMLDLATYRPVSTLPGTRRDISIAIDADADVELLGDRVREALGRDAEMVEAVTILSTTPYAELPGTARQRLGICPHQRNVLVRLDIRPFDRTITDAAANALRDRVFRALHQGDPSTDGG